MLYEWCAAGHVQEVVAHHVVALTKVAVVAGHAVVPVATMRGVPANRAHVDHVRRNRQTSRLIETTATGVPVRSDILLLLGDELLSHR